MSISRETIGLGILAVAVNIALAIIKIGVGVVGNSYALIADGIESAGDIISSLITWAGFQLSLKPADADHPYGHGKIESLAGMFSGFSLWVSAGIIAWQSIERIQTPHESPEWFTLPVLVGVVVVKWLLAKKIRIAGDSLESNALRGDAGHHLSDAITSAATAIGIFIALVGGPGYEMADDWAALITCVLIVYNGYRILFGSLHDVLDGQVDSDIYEKIAKLAAEVPGVIAPEKCRVRRSGIDLLVDLHIEVAPEITVREGHDIGHRVKDHLLAGDRRIKDVLIHIEPAGHEDECPVDEVIS